MNFDIKSPHSTEHGKKQIKKTCTTSSISNPTREKILTNYQSMTIPTNRWWRYRQDTTILNNRKHSTPMCCRNNLPWWYLLHRSTNVWQDIHHPFELCEMIVFWDPPILDQIFTIHLSYVNWYTFEIHQCLTRYSSSIWAMWNDILLRSTNVWLDIHHLFELCE